MALLCGIVTGMTQSNDARLGLDSLAVHAGRDDLKALGVHAAPIDLSSTYALPSVDDGGDAYERLATGGDVGDGSAVYQRLWNPTVARFERALAQRTRRASGLPGLLSVRRPPARRG